MGHLRHGACSRTCTAPVTGSSGWALPDFRFGPKPGTCVQSRGPTVSGLDGDVFKPPPDRAVPRAVGSKVTG
jgi:hypothetical protein